MQSSEYQRMDSENNREEKDKYVHTREEMEAKAHLLNSETEGDVFESIVYFRKILEENPSNISRVLDLNILRRIIDLLSSSGENDSHLDLYCEAALVLVKIASGESSACKQMVDVGGVTALIEILSRGECEITDQALWALGNIIGNGAKLRDYVLDHGIVPAILKMSESVPTMSSKTVNVFTSVIANLCQYEPFHSPEKVAPLVGLLTQVLTHRRSEESTRSVCSALVAVTNDNQDLIQAVIDTGVCPVLLSLLNREDELAVGIVKIFCNIVSGTDEQAQSVLDLGILESMKALVQRSDSIQAGLYSFLSSLLAGTDEQIQSVIDSGLMEPVVASLSTHGTQDVLMECCWCISNLVQSGNMDQVRYVASLGCIPLLCAHLSDEDPDLLSLVLEGLDGILKVGMEEAINPYKCEIEDNGLDEIREIAKTRRIDNYETAIKILHDYFPECC